jgi:hypothetical protein
VTASSGRASPLHVGWTDERPRKFRDIFEQIYRPRIEGDNHDGMPMNDEAPCRSYRDADLSHVDVADPYAVRWWCQRFVCTASMLRAAVGAVGARSWDVEAYLKGRTPAPRRTRAAGAKAADAASRASRDP